MYIYIIYMRMFRSVAMAGILTSTADYSITSYRTAVSFHLFMAKFEAWISYQNTVTNYSVCNICIHMPSSKWLNGL